MKTVAVTAIFAAGVFLISAQPAHAASFTVDITADQNGSISGVISGTPPTIISPTTSANVTVPDGESAVFNFDAADYYQIADVLVDGSSVGTSTSYVFPASTSGSHTLDVSFEQIPDYTITASAGAGGSVSPSGNIATDVSQTRTFTISPNAGYRIADVLVDGSSVGTVASYTFPEFPSGTSGHTLTASFAADTFTLTASASAGGSISPSGASTVDGGDTQTYVISPANGYTISGLLIDGVSVATTSSYTFSNITANHTIAASFAQSGVQTHTITASAGAGGSITPSGDIQVSDGADQSFTIAAASGYHIDDVTVDGSSVGAVDSYDFTAVTASHTIEVFFAADAPQGGGGGSSSGGSSGGGSGPVLLTPPEEGFGFHITPKETATRTVMLVLDGGQDASHVLISEDTDFTAAEIIKISSSDGGTTTPWTLSGNAGEKTLYAKFRSWRGFSTLPLLATVRYTPVLEEAQDSAEESAVTTVADVEHTSDDTSDDSRDTEQTATEMEDAAIKDASSKEALGEEGSSEEDIAQTSATASDMAAAVTASVEDSEGQEKGVVSRAIQNILAGIKKFFALLFPF